ncbi:MAG: permease-like cell division protein FtsX [Burkholderiales bacterium]|nr:permease-like cell division protein FtsX [Burkholderiales bacterium]
MSAWLRVHRLALADAARRLAAQPLASVLSIAVIALAVALPVLASAFVQSVARATAVLDTDPHVNVFLALDATDEDVRRVEAALKAHPETASVRFVPRAKALEELKATTHLAELLANLDRNPLPHAFSVRTRSSQAARLAAARADWSKLTKVDQVSAEFEWAEKISHWTSFAHRALAGLALVLAAAVLFIVGHLIRLQVLTRKEEIEVSQLIGATAADVRRPFLYHGLLQGLAAGLAAVGLAALVIAWLNVELSALTSSYAYEIKLVFMGYEAMAGVIVAVGALGVTGAWVSVSRELKRFSVAG